MACLQHKLAFVFQYPNNQSTTKQIDWAFENLAVNGIGNNSFSLLVDDWKISVFMLALINGTEMRNNLLT